MIGDVLKRLREEKNVNQEEIAKLLVIKRQTYSAYERNKSTPDANTIKFLAKYFDVSSDFLLELDDYNFCESCANQSDATSIDDPVYASMVNLWNQMDHGKKMMTLGYMERLAEEQTKIVVNAHSKT